MSYQGLPDISADKESGCNARDPDSIPGSGRPPGEGTGYPLQYFWASLVAQMEKNLPAMQETWVRPWFRTIPRRRPWRPTAVFLPGGAPRAEEPGSCSRRSHRAGHGRAQRLAHSVRQTSTQILTQVFFQPLVPFDQLVNYGKIMCPSFIGHYPAARHNFKLTVF